MIASIETFATLSILKHCFFKLKILDFSSSRIDRPPPPQKKRSLGSYFATISMVIDFFYSFFDVLEPPDHFLKEKNCFEKNFRKKKFEKKILKKIIPKKNFEKINFLKKFR